MSPRVRSFIWSIVFLMWGTVFHPIFFLPAFIFLLLFIKSRSPPANTSNNCPECHSRAIVIVPEEVPSLGLFSPGGIRYYHLCKDCGTLWTIFVKDSDV